MVLATLAESVSALMKSPALWIPGIVAGILAAGNVVLQYSMGTLFVTKVWYIEAVAVPFLVAGAYSLIRSGDGGVGSFLWGGARCYLRVLLPSLVIAFAILATIVLLAIPLSLVGNPVVFLPYIVSGPRSRYSSSPSSLTAQRSSKTATSSRASGGASRSC